MRRWRGGASLPSPVGRRSRCARSSREPRKTTSRSPGSVRPENPTEGGVVEDSMKYICLGYLEPGQFENMSEGDRNTMLDECFGYNDELRRNGHLVAEEPLQPANTAVTVSWTNGTVAVTDG